MYWGFAADLIPLLIEGESDGYGDKGKETARSSADPRAA